MDENQQIAGKFLNHILDRYNDLDSTDYNAVLDCHDNTRSLFSSIFRIQESRSLIRVRYLLELISVAELQAKCPHIADVALQLAYADYHGNLKEIYIDHMISFLQLGFEPSMNWIVEMITYYQYWYLVQADSTRPLSFDSSGKRKRDYERVSKKQFVGTKIKLLRCIIEIFPQVQSRLSTYAHLLDQILIFQTAAKMTKSDIFYHIETYVECIMPDYVYAVRLPGNLEASVDDVDYFRLTASGAGTIKCYGIHFDNASRHIISHFATRYEGVDRLTELTQEILREALR